MDRLQETLLYILKRASERNIDNLSMFQLVKLVYLIQIESQKFTGNPFIENLRFFREKNGPLSKRIYLAINNLKGKYIDIKEVPNKSYGHPRLEHRLKKKDLNFTNLSFEETIFLNSVLDDYLDLTQNKLKEIVYATEPMQQVVKLEKKTGSEMIGKPIDMNLVSLDREVLDAISQNEL